MKQQDWCELYATKTSAWEYGIWHLAAQGALETKKAEVKTRSFQLGISLHYVFEELQVELGRGWGDAGEPLNLEEQTD